MGSEREGQAALSSVWKKAREGKVRFVSTIESIKSRTYRSILHLISARLVAAIWKEKKSARVWTSSKSHENPPVG